jgi:serine/threonine protein kinase
MQPQVCNSNLTDVHTDVWTETNYIASAQQSSVASDWWSIGVIAYELLNGVVSVNL